MVVGMQARLVPLFAWYLALADSGFKGSVVPPYAMPIRSLQQVIFTAWAFAVPSIAVGFALNAIPLLSAGAWTLLAGVILSAGGNWAVARPALSNIRHFVKNRRDFRGGEVARRMLNQSTVVSRQSSV